MHDDDAAVATFWLLDPKRTRSPSQIGQRFNSFGLTKALENATHQFSAERHRKIMGGHPAGAEGEMDIIIFAQFQIGHINSENNQTTGYGATSKWAQVSKVAKVDQFYHRRRDRWQ